MKNLLLVTAVAMALSACGGTKLPWKKNKVSEVAASTAAIPTQVDTVAKSADSAAEKLKQKESSVIAYFDADGNLVETAQKGGFYRKLLGRNKAGLAVVQDFYQDNQAKQTNPMVVPDDKNLKNFDSAIAEGRVIWYSPEGKVTEFLDYHKGLVQRGGYYNEMGVLVLETEGDNSKDVNAKVKVRGFYENGKLLFENTQEKNDSVSVFYYDNGQKMWHAVSNSETIHAWTKEGKPVELSDISEAASAAEKRATELMQKYMGGN